MRIGQRVTVRFLHPQPFGKFLRCYVTRKVGGGWQLYDPVRKWSWGIQDGQRSKRVLFVV